MFIFGKNKKNKLKNNAEVQTIKTAAEAGETASEAIYIKDEFDLFLEEAKPFRVEKVPPLDIHYTINPSTLIAEIKEDANCTSLLFFTTEEKNIQAYNEVIERLVEVPQITTLYISCPLKYRSIKKALKENHHLKSIVFYLGWDGQEDLSNLMDALYANDSVTDITLMDCRHMTQGGAEAVVRMLEANKNIKSLSFDACTFPFEVGKILYEGIAKYADLHHLIIVDEHKNGAPYLIADIIKSNRNLKTFQAWHSSLDVKRGDFLSAIREHKSLRVFDIRNNNIQHDEDLIELGESLKGNPLQVIRIEGQYERIFLKDRKETYPRLAEICSSNDGLLYFSGEAELRSYIEEAFHKEKKALPPIETLSFKSGWDYTSVSRLDEARELFNDVMEKGFVDTDKYSYETLAKNWWGIHQIINEGTVGISYQEDLNRAKAANIFNAFVAKTAEENLIRKNNRTLHGIASEDFIDKNGKPKTMAYGYAQKFAEVEKILHDGNLSHEEKRKIFFAIKKTEILSEEEIKKGDAILVKSLQKILIEQRKFENIRE